MNEQRRPKILAIDPGKDVGFSSNWASPAWQVTYSDKSSVPHKLLYQDLEILKPDVIVCERFDYRQAKHGVDLIAAEYIGVITLYAQSQNKFLHFQGQNVKSRTKGYWSVKKLRYLGLYIAGDDHKDAMDALCHRLQFELDNGLFDVMQFKHLC